MDSWITASQPSSYYLSMDEDENPDQELMDEILSDLSKTMDLSDYDSDNNGTIDAVICVNTLAIDSTSDGNILQWAYRYWNMYSDDGTYLNSYDDVCAWDYLWASYQFLFETVDANGHTSFDGPNATNTYTFIHEFGHVLGADDYYDTDYSEKITLDGHDVMDSEIGDHNPYSKFNYGWLTESRLVTDSVSLDLEAFATNGDTIILANNWDTTLGAYQEYYVLMYYTNTGLNGGDYGYFDEEGVVMYHVDASLIKYDNLTLMDGSQAYDVYNTNSSSSENALIELVKNGSSYVYGVGDTSSSTIKDNNDETLGFTFTVNSLDTTKASLTFTKA
ncbi:MAG: hypothetical protein WCR67_01545 [Bacilli bacterium]